MRFSGFGRFGSAAAPTNGDVAAWLITQIQAKTPMGMLPTFKGPDGTTLLQKAMVFLGYKAKAISAPCNGTSNRLAKTTNTDTCAWEWWVTAHPGYIDNAVNVQNNNGTTMLIADLNKLVGSLTPAVNAYGYVWSAILSGMAPAGTQGGVVNATVTPGGTVTSVIPARSGQFTDPLPGGNVSSSVPPAKSKAGVAIGGAVGSLIVAKLLGFI